MAEETTHISLSPDIKKLDKVNPRRNSTGIVKRSSTGKFSSKNYLRASTGSCHDFCKFGREHSFQVKARNPKSIRTTPSSDKQKNIASEVLAQKLKTSAVKLKLSDFKGRLSEQNLGTSVHDEKKKESKVKLKPSYDVHSPEPPEVIKREIMPSKQLQVTFKQTSSNTKTMKDNERKTMSSSKWSPSPESRPLLKNPSSSTASVGLNGTRKTSTKPGKITGTSKTTVKKLSATPSSSSSPKTYGGRAVNLYARKQSSVKLASPLKDQKRTQRSKLKKPDENKVRERTLHVVQSDTDDKFMKPVQGDCIVQISSSQSLQSLNSLSFPGSQFTSSQDVIEESEYINVDLQKSQHIDSEDLDESEEATAGDLEESEYTESEADEFISEDDESVNINEVDTGYQSQRIKEGRIVCSANKDDALARSKFRKGRIVDLQSTSNVPRRLKFRRGRVVGGNGDESVARRDFEKREVGDDPNDASPSSNQVVLRHQDMHGKKDAQGLYNNVIEETASKLVESRKSKVKALVGAFETVISLQES